jgi:hypothetical protein
MKRSEFVKCLVGGLSDIWDHVHGTDSFAKIFNDNSKSDFLSLDSIQTELNSIHLIKHVYSSLFDKIGNKLDLKIATADAAKELENFFKVSNIRKTITYDGFCDRYLQKAKHNYDDHVFALAEVITRGLEKTGRPPLFHKRQDKVLRYDWENEDD